MFELLRKDLRRNRGNSKGVLIAVAFRAASACHRLGRRNALLRVVCAIPVALYKGVFDYLMCVYIPPGARIGGGLVVFHGFGIVVNERAVIGENCTLRHNVTIGARGADGHDCPTIGDGVDIGAGALVLGAVTVGDGARIGAGAIVVRDVPPGAAAIGEPARIVGGGQTGRLAGGSGA